MGKITVREPHPDDPIYREGLRMYSVRLGPEVAQKSNSKPASLKLPETEIRATAAAFCYHQGAIFGGLVPPLLTYFAITWDLGFAIPMLVGTMFGLVNFILSLVFGPETKGTVMVPDLVVA
jgi:hypothetical protein